MGLKNVKNNAFWEVQEKNNVATKGMEMKLKKYSSHFEATKETEYKQLSALLQSRLKKLREY